MSAQRNSNVSKPTTTSAPLFTPQQQPSKTDAIHDPNTILEMINSIYNDTEPDRDRATKMIKTILYSLKSLLSTSNVSMEAEKSPYIAMLSVARKFPTLFSSPDLLEKKNNLAMILACNLLMVGYDMIEEWPPQLFYAYVDDAMGDRLWVDDQHCKPFAQNILASMPSKPMPTLANAPPLVPPPPPPPSQKPAATTTATTTPKSESMEEDNEEEEEEEEILSSSSTMARGAPKPVNRFAHCHADVVRYIVRLVRGTNATFNARGLVRLLQATVGFRESRVEGAQVIEGLLANQGIFRLAKEYLHTLIAHTSETTPEDLRVVQILMRIQAPHTDIISMLLTNNSAAYSSIALRYAIDIELDVVAGGATGPKAPPKSRLPTVFKYLTGGRGEEELAGLFKELASRDDYPRLAAKMLIRKILKHFGSMNIAHLSSQLLDIGRDQAYLMLDAPAKERWAHNLVHIICQILLFIPTMDLAKDVISMRALLSSITSSAITWIFNLIEVVITSPLDIFDFIRKTLFFEPINSYFPVPNAIIDADRIAYRTLTIDVQIQESTIQVLLNLAFEYRIEKKAILDFIDALLRRSTNINSRLGVGPQITGTKLADSILALSETPSTIGGVRLAFTAYFWQSAIAVCMLACLSPTVVAAHFWQHCPTIRTLLEMIITRSWRFPAFLPKGATSNVYHANEALMKSKESDILKKYPQLQQIEFNLLDIGGVARAPPDEIIERLQKMDNDFHLGFALCACRQPDYLLEIMASQESRAAMAWLNPIIHNDPRTLDILPPVCLAEVLMSTQLDASIMSIAPKLMARFSVLFNATTSQPTIDIIKFFLAALCVPSPNTRSLARRALATLPIIGQPVPTSPNDDFQWLTRMSQLPWHDSVQTLIWQSLIGALHVETDRRAIHAYLTNLAQSDRPQTLFQEISRLILHRDVVSRYLLGDNELADILLDLLAQGLDSAVDSTDASTPTTKWTLESANGPRIISLPTDLLYAIIYALSNISLSFAKADALASRLLACDNSTVQFTSAQCTAMLQSPYSGLIHIAATQLKTQPDLLAKQSESLGLSQAARTEINKHLPHAGENGVESSDSMDIDTTPTITRSNGRSILAGFTKARASQSTSDIPMSSPSKFSEIIEADDAKLAKCIESIGAIDLLPMTRALVPLSMHHKASYTRLGAALATASQESSLPRYLVQRLGLTPRDTATDPSVQHTKESLTSAITLSTASPTHEETLGRLFGSMFSVRSPKESNNRRIVLHSLIDAVDNPALASSTGLHLDWLLVILSQCEPQDLVDGVSHLMFGHEALPLATLLHSHILHTGTWRVLAAFISALFAPTRAPLAIISAQAVLSFVHAYHAHPRSGAPYYAATANPYGPDAATLHYLTPASTRALADYVVREMDDAGASASQATLERRSVLLTAAARMSPANLIALAMHLNNAKRSASKSSSSPSSLLRRLYFAFPTLVKSLIANYSPAIIDSSTPVPHTQLDIAIHRVILKICEPDLRNEGFILFRRLAIDHPELITMHLPTIHSLFAGRSLLPLDQFVQKKHHILFYQVLHILDILKPFVFNSPYLEKILDEYYLMLGGLRTHVEELAPLVAKFVEFLGSCAARNTQLSVVHRNNDLFGTTTPLSMDYNQMNGKMGGTTMTTLDKAGEERIGRLVQDIDHQLKMSFSEERLMKMLEEVEHISYTSPMLLKQCLKVLLVLLTSASNAVQSISYFLVLRYLNHSPKQADAVIESYLTCFRSPNPDIVRAALRKSSDFYYFTRVTSETRPEATQSEPD
eukprot:gene10319-12031_t